MRHSGKTADDPSFRRLAAGGGRRFSRAADRLRRESGDRRPANGGPLRRNRLRRSRLPGRLHGERNPTGAFSEGKTERSYGWGTLTVLIEPYASCPALWQATLTVKIAGGRKRMEYRYLVDPDGFDRNTIIGNE
ncbi:MAG: hypothetical protein ACLR1G_04420 [Alistipes indistinctus]